MKKNMIVILVGVTALHVVIFSGLFASGGCKNVVMDERRYVPAEGSDAPMTVDPMENVPPTTSFRPAEPQTRPVAAPQTRKPEAPTYQPMASVASKPISTPSTASSSAAGGTYEVKAGDTVGKIAQQYGVSVSAMLKANNLDLQSARRLRIGQKLVIPGRDGAAAPRKSAASSSKKSAAPATATLAADGTYVIKAGDTLGKIARQLGVKTADLQKANNLTDAQTRRLQIGQKLVVPGKSTRSASTTAAASSGSSAATSTTAVTASSTAAATTAATASSDAATTTPAAGTAAATTSDDIALDLSAALNEAANAATTTPAAGTATGDTATAISETEIVIGSSTPVEVTEEVDLATFATNNKTTVEALKKLNSDLPVDGKLKPGLILFVPAAE